MFGGPQKSSEAHQWAAALLLRNSDSEHMPTLKHFLSKKIVSVAFQNYFWIWQVGEHVKRFSRLINEEKNMFWNLYYFWTTIKTWKKRLVFNQIYSLRIVVI